MTGWTDAEIEIVKDGAAKGESAAVIAGRLRGRSRNSVVGVCLRKKIALGGSAGRPSKNGMAAVVMRDKAAAARRAKASSASPYSAEEDALIREHAGKKTAREIAPMLNQRSADSVRGRASILGVSLAGATKRAAAGPRGVRSSFNFDLPASMPKPPRAEREPVVVADVEKVAFMDLRFNHCRFPLWPAGAPFAEMFFCGAPKVSGCPYCAVHREIATTAPRERRAA